MERFGTCSQSGAAKELLFGLARPNSGLTLPLCLAGQKERETERERERAREQGQKKGKHDSTTDDLI